MTNANKKQNGFTLIEALIATFLFSIVISAVMGIYNSTLKTNRRTDAVRLAAENVRYISEFLSKEIRNGRIDYTGPYIYVCTANSISHSGSSSLQIINVDGDKECFYNDGTYLFIMKQPANSATALTAQALNLSFSKVSSLIFYVQPETLSNPPVSTISPSVTIRGTLVANKDPLNIVTLPFQTSVTIPQYEITGN